MASVSVSFCGCSHFSTLALLTPSLASQPCTCFRPCHFIPSILLLLANSLLLPHQLVEQPETTSISTHHLDQHIPHQSIHRHIQHCRSNTLKQSERKWHSCIRTASYQPSRSPDLLALPDFARLQTSSGTVLSPSPYPCGRCNVPTPLQLLPRRTPAGGSESGRSIYPAQPPSFYACA